MNGQGLNCRSLVKVNDVDTRHLMNKKSKFDPTLAILVT